MSDLSDARILRAIELCRESAPQAIPSDENADPRGGDPLVAYVADLRRGGMQASARVRAWVPAHLRHLLAG